MVLHSRAFSLGCCKGSGTPLIVLSHAGMLLPLHACLAGSYILCATVANVRSAHFVCLYVCILTLTCMIKLYQFLNAVNLVLYPASRSMGRSGLTLYVSHEGIYASIASL